MSRNALHRQAGPRHQSGAALVVTLILLVLVTILGLAAMRNAILQERMAANAVSRGYAFQAAEAGLRQAEEAARSASTPTAAGCSNGICLKPPPGDPALWLDADLWDDDGGSRAVNTAYGNLDEDGTGEITARYIIEYFGESDVGDSGFESVDLVNVGAPMDDTVRNWRITVRAVTANGAEVLLQSMYQAP